MPDTSANMFMNILQTAWMTGNVLGLSHKLCEALAYVLQDLLLQGFVHVVDGVMKLVKSDD